MKKEDLETLPPGVSLILKDVMHRCRERPPSNWPANVYELVDRQDLAALGTHLNSLHMNDPNDNDGKNYLTKDLDQDDGMEFDDNVISKYTHTYILFIFNQMFNKIYIYRY